MIHELKCWPDPFQAILDDLKTYEIRRDDRLFAVGERILLREFQPHAECRGSGRCWDNGDTTDCCVEPHGSFTGRECLVEITYKTTGGEWGIPNDLCVLAIRKVSPT